MCECACVEDGGDGRYVYWEWGEESYVHRYVCDGVCRKRVHVNHHVYVRVSGKVVCSTR